MGETPEEHLKRSTTALRTSVQWLVEPPLSLRSWGVRILIAAMVCLLLTSVMALASSKQVLNELESDRSARTARTCLILSKLDATPQEKRDAGCP